MVHACQQLNQCNSPVVAHTVLVLSFLRNRGATKSSDWKLIWLGAIAGLSDGCCIFKKAWIDLTSESYELSAIVLPFDASLQAAIHLAYCPS